MKKNKVKGAKTTKENTKYISVSKYGNNDNKIEAYSVIIYNAGNDQIIQSEILIKDKETSRKKERAKLMDLVKKFCTIHKCRAIMDFETYPIRFQENGDFIASYIDHNYFRIALLQESTKAIYMHELRNKINTELYNPLNTSEKVDHKTELDLMLNSLLDKYYPYAKLLIN